DRLAVSPTDAQRLPRDHEARRIHPTLAQRVGERPDLRRLAAPPARLAVGPVALRRQSALDVSRGAAETLRPAPTPGITEAKGPVISTRTVPSGSITMPAVAVSCRSPEPSGRMEKS